jgi:hypothetical protein
LPEDDSTTRLEKKLRRLGKLGYLDRLVRDGCERTTILLGLELLELLTQWDRWPGLAGANLRQLRARIRQIERTAGVIDKLNSQPIVATPRLLNSTADSDFYQLPGMLRRYAATLKARQEIFGPKHQRGKNSVVAFIVDRVLDPTGKPHDNEVGELLSAVLGPEWNADTVKVWRGRHRSDIDEARRARVARESTRLTRR